MYRYWVLPRIWNRMGLGRPSEAGALGCEQDGFPWQAACLANDHPRVSVHAGVSRRSRYPNM